MIEIWIAFGTGKDLRYVPAHEISASFGPKKSVALPVFHPFTGCDTVSHFAPVAHGAPEEITNDVYSALARFNILMYDRTRTLVSIDETRKLLFTRKFHPIYSILELSPYLNCVRYI